MWNILLLKSWKNFLSHLMYFGPSELPNLFSSFYIYIYIYKYFCLRAINLFLLYIYITAKNIQSIKIHRCHNRTIKLQFSLMQKLHRPVKVNIYNFTISYDFLLLFNALLFILSQFLSKIFRLSVEIFYYWEYNTFFSLFIKFGTKVPVFFKVLKVPVLLKFRNLKYCT